MNTCDQVERHETMPRNGVRRKSVWSQPKDGVSNLERHLGANLRHNARIFKPKDLDLPWVHARGVHHNTKVQTYREDANFNLSRLRSTIVSGDEFQAAQHTPFLLFIIIISRRPTASSHRTCWPSLQSSIYKQTVGMPSCPHRNEVPSDIASCVLLAISDRNASNCDAMLQVTSKSTIVY
jgi:hypothetical protein